MSDRSPAKQRGDIQAGKTGDKIPGFDPAVAPMETDAEASGVSTPHGADGAVRTAPEHTNASSHGPAMRPQEEPALRVETRSRRKEAMALAVALAIAAVIAIAFVVA